MSHAETEAKASSTSPDISPRLEHSSDPAGRDSGGFEATSGELQNHGLSRSRIWLWLAFALLALILLILWQLQSQTISPDGMGVARHHPVAPSSIGLQTSIERSDQPIDLV